MTKTQGSKQFGIYYLDFVLVCDSALVILNL